MALLNEVTGAVLTDRLAAIEYTFGLNGHVQIPQALSSAANQTLQPFQLLCGTLRRAGANTATDTTPTAAQLVAALSGVQNGQALKWTIRNEGTGTHTLANGTGVTLATGNTNTTATVSAHDFLIAFTNVVPGSEAVTIYSLTTSTY